ncbi:MAG TPA: hypothetical protein VFP93_03185, partial [Gammaproteobacteria bacterium]|nr:hypothetical protein [Gammaproteobacteria bacterium]
TLFDNMTPLFHAIKLKRSLFARHLIRANVNLNAVCHEVSILHQAILSKEEVIIQELLQKGVDKSVPVQALTALSSVAIFDDLFPHATLYGYKFSSLLKDPSLISSISTFQMFRRNTTILGYLEKNNFCTELVIAALRILELADKIKEFERSQIVGNETAMNDAKVLRARWHFNNNVQPHFKDKFLQYSSAKDADEALIAVEKHIKAVILEEIMKRAQVENNTTIVDFLTTHGNALIAGQEDALKASCSVLNAMDTLQSAWRCYNPYAPVKANWLNLLTEPVNDIEVFSIAAAHNGQITAKQASKIIRERVAYYFLAVMDENDGDESVRETRKMNFFSQLQDIRNAHGPDDPTCYPGAITRCADMGSFHDVAQLPTTTKEWLSDYFKTKALATLAQEFTKLTTFEEKEALSSAIIQLTEGSINAIIQNPTNYPKEWLALRKHFIHSLGTSQENLEKILLEGTSPITQADLIYIEQCLLDIGAGDRGQAFATFFNSNTDYIPSQEEIEQANPFKSHENAYALSKIMLDIILHLVPSYTKSMRQLKTLTEFLQQKVPALLQGQPLSEIIDDMRLTPETQAAVFQAIDANWKFAPAVVNPFTAKIEAARKQIELKANQPQFQMVFKRQLDNLLRKSELFLKHYPMIKEIVENANPKLDATDAIRIAEELANYFALEETFIQIEFQKQFSEAYVAKNAALFEMLSAKLTNPTGQTPRTSL